MFGVVLSFCSARRERRLGLILVFCNLLHKY
jgi:hypothetical protein